MRTIRELLIILRDSLAKGERTDYHNMGICAEISDLYSKGIIDLNQKRLLNNHIASNRPTTYVNPEFKYPKKLRHFWWPDMRLGVEYRLLRIKFIEKLISLEND